MASHSSRRFLGKQRFIRQRYGLPLFMEHGQKRWFHDPALEWARTNPAEAQRWFQLPPNWDDDSIRPTFSSNVLNSLEAYCRWRGWKNVPEAVESKILALTSHVLSAPLTIAALMFQDPKLLQHISSTRQLRLCCIGARAEATLPHEYWEELLLVLYGMATNPNGKPLHLALDFVGPDIQPQTLPTTLSWRGSTIALRWLYKGFWHDLSPSADRWDVYLLFNPGIGHENLKHNWKPTLDRLLMSSPSTLPHQPLPLLFLTAHSQLDAKRDESLLKDIYQQTDLDYKQNPFASRIQYQDPFAKDHLVRPNQYMAQIRCSEREGWK